jgi:hypothetical protein
VISVKGFAHFSSDRLSLHFLSYKKWCENNRTQIVFSESGQILWLFKNVRVMNFCVKMFEFIHPMGLQPKSGLGLLCEVPYGNLPYIPLSSALQPIVHCPWTTTRRLRVWVCWQSLQVEYTGSFLVFNRACLLASACPTRAIPAFGLENVWIININFLICLMNFSCNENRFVCFTYSPSPLIIWQACLILA